ncbi:chemotaxis protein CheW [Rhodoferax sp. U11-2br]|uniref:chemotaxis protein CheW n=1 Tax=Rhodoferax sp. U11-2br TaxID=2838878 RepID=UPI001BE689C8|nr:chemotaxis protein CheW [Rhodoferax sp. U11-2br]MBT3068030.1 chemotaxis protein CheW [Rhodoferax sp. U11-2br]
MENTQGKGSANPKPAEKAAREYLSFQLGSVEYGIDILKVQEIRGFETSTRMFNAPPYVLGVLNMRGVIVPILDMRLKFEMAEVAYNSQTVTIVLNVANRVVGMVVDAVQDVVAIQATEVKPAPDFNGAVNTQHIIGIATVDQAEQQRMLVLLDIEKLMSGADMGLVAEAVA